MLSKTPKGEVARNYFIEVEKRFKEITSRPLELPQNFADACRMLAETWEHEQILKAQVQELAPKAEAFDLFLDGQGYYKVNTAAKMLSTGSKRLYKFLRDLGALMDNNKPYQKYVDNGYFVVKAGVAGNGYNYSTTLVSPKGMDFIIKQMKKL
jgi:phage antirepressor YoqD-like protein